MVVQHLFQPNQHINGQCLRKFLVCFNLMNNLHEDEVPLSFDNLFFSLVLSVYSYDAVIVTKNRFLIQ